MMAAKPPFKHYQQISKKRRSVKLSRPYKTVFTALLPSFRLRYTRLLAACSAHPIGGRH
ncbi:hypothetical protein [Prevotella falsenii]|uniref:hypothetical protein n=1 Tax=Prevotella falsenii TaxID=515414 RepID=UPI0012EBDC44|nr:hypothetical protein [Prevotella falsenii]